jgi:hypothetical protein
VKVFFAFITPADFLLVPFGDTIIGAFAQLWTDKRAQLDRNELPGKRRAE